MSTLAPIALFACDQPEHTKRTLDALSRNEQAADSELTIYCDAPRDEGGGAAAAAVRSLARKATGFKTVSVVEAERHAGVNASLIAGVTRTLEDHDRIIVLDDDLVTSPYFLGFMNEALERYHGESRVLCACGYSGSTALPLPETYFLPGAHFWGWATWRRGWDLFEPDGRKVLGEIVRRDLIYAFDFEGAEPLTRLLADAVDSGQSSWSLCWMASAILNDKLTLYPGESLVRKVDLDASLSAFETELCTQRPRVGQAPIEVDRAVLAQVRSLLIRWRCEESTRGRAYYRLASVLPSNIERRLYTALVKALLRRSDTYPAMRVSSSGRASMSG